MIHSVRGFRDIFSPDSDRLAALETASREIFRLYGFSELRLPTVEQRELFVKSTGETTDIVEKEMYVFQDAGERQLALRPEGTPGIVRAYLENNLYTAEPRQKLFYIGNMFRAERPQAGRFREFEQIGAEYLGNPHPCADAETITMLAAIISKAGVSEFNIEINSLGCQKCRPAYREKLLAYLNENKESLCDNCKKRIERNPLRALDCKTDGPRLGATAPKQDFCPECAEHFTQVQSLLNGAGLEYTVNPNLVRGLDYYSRTVFEFRAGGIGSQDAIAAGGRYDSLVKSMGGPEVAAVGWALGADRVIASVGKTEQQQAKAGAFVIALGAAAAPKAFSLMQELRKRGIFADCANLGQSIKSQMRSAGKSSVRFAAIIGDNELAKGICVLKDLSAGTQEEVNLSSAADKISATI